MTAARYKTSDYLAALQRLLPPGRAWPREPDAVLTAVLNGLAAVYNRTDQSGQSLLTNTFPASASTDFIPTWAATLQYSNIYGFGPYTQAQKQAQIVATLTDSGGQSIPYFIESAASLGYAITIWNGDQGYSVDSPVDDAMISSTSPFTFQVNVAAGTDTTMLKAMLDLFKPAHTSYYFNFI